MVVEIKGLKPAVGGFIGIGLLASVVAVATLVNHRIPLAAASGILAFGLALLLIAIRALVTQRYQLRATEQGVTFASSVLVEWSQNDQIFVGRMKLMLTPMTDVPPFLSITFRCRQTVLRLPLTYWISSPFSIGHVDIALAKATEPPHTIVAKLEALRAHALGTIDGVTTGASTIPAARVVERPR